MELICVQGPQGSYQRAFTWLLFVCRAVGSTGASPELCSSLQGLGNCCHTWPCPELRSRGPYLR